MELKSFHLFIYLFVFLYIYLFLLDWKAVSRLRGRTATWQDLSHFTFFLPLSLSHTHTVHTHTHTKTHTYPCRESPSALPDKSETSDEWQMDKYANLPSIYPLFRHSSSDSQLFVLFHQTLSNFSSRFLHHPAYFCLAHPLANSVTSPYVSHLSPPALLLSCQMPVIHSWSVCTSCCSSLSSHPHTLTSSSLFLPLIQLGSSPSLPRSFALLNSSSPTVFPPSSCALDKCLCHMHFHHCKTNGIGGGCNTHSYYPVTLPLCGFLPSFLLQQLSKIHHFLYPCQVNHLLPPLSLGARLSVWLWQSCFMVCSQWLWGCCTVCGPEVEWND